MSQSNTKQHGAATLLVTITMLLVVSIVMLMSNRSTFLEQKTATNQLKRSIAFDAAQSGLDQFVAQLLDINSGVATQYMTGAAGAFTGVNSSYSNPDSSLNANGYFNSVASASFHDFTTTNTITLKPANNSTKNFAGITIPGPAGSNQLLSYSIYLVDLGAGRIKVFSRGCADEVCPTSQTATSTAFAEAVVSVEVNVNGQTRCTIEVNDTISVSNDSSLNGYAAVGSCGVGIGNPNIADGGGNTLFTPPNFDIQSCPPAGCRPRVTAQIGTPTQNGVTINGVNSATDSYFTNYFGKNPATVQGSASTHTVTGNVSNNALCTALDNARTANKKTLWITGDLSLSGAGAYCTLGAPGYAETRTTPPKPVTIIVGGDLTVSGASNTIYGLLFVRGSANVAPLTGALTINGGLAFEGSVSLNSSIAVFSPASTPSLGFTLDDFELPPVSSSGSKLNQTWRDF